MYIPITFTKTLLISDVFVRVWCFFSGKLSNAQYQTMNDKQLCTGLVVR